MAYKLKKNIANSKNYGGKRNTNDIKWIVIHYTANDGDHDESNANYFHNNVVGASAHYFVDSDSITQSVPDDYVAYAVGRDYRSNGGGTYYGKCTNKNSISIELCDDNKNGKIYPSDDTINNAINFTKVLMKKYNIPAQRVIRHYDVNGKKCPAYWVDDKKWENEFHCKLTDNKSKAVTKKVKINTTVLNVRSGPGTNYDIVITVKKDQVYTIVEEKNGWGKLKSGAGWIKLSYTITV